MHRFTFLLLISLMAISLCANSSQMTHAQSNLSKITIFHTNDIHGDASEIGMQTYGRLSAYMSEARQRLGAENVLLLDAGDAMAGYACENDDVFLIDDALRHIGFNALIFGNHEFDCGSPLVEARYKNAAPLTFLAANISRKDRDGACTWEPYFEDYRLFQVGLAENQVRVAVIGLSRTTGFISRKDACVHNPIDALIYSYDAARTEGAQVFVLISHMGPYDNTPLPQAMGGKTLLDAMAEAGRPLHLVIGGHDHNLVGDKIGPAYLVESGEYLKQIGIATITVDQSAQKVNVTWTSQPIAKTAPQDPGIAAIYQSYGWIDPFELRHLTP